MTTPIGLSGAVLCGGSSRRMGRDKATLVVDGEAMAARVAAALRAAGADDVFAVGGDPVALGRLGLDVIPDDQPGEGPFPATLTALRHARGPLVAVLSCDLRTPRRDAVTHLVSALEAAGPGVLGAVPLVGGHHQWTHVVWRAEALAALEAAQVAGARSLRRAAGPLPLLEVRDVAAEAVADADTPDDLAGPASGGIRGGGSLRAMDIPEVDVAEVAERQGAGAAIIDVREPAEVAEARVPGAIHIPLGQVVERVDEVPAEGTVYVICARGARSAKAVDFYRRQGIDAVNVTGGTIAWLEAGLPIDRVGSEAGGA